MYIVGHCVMTEKSGVFNHNQVYGEGVFSLMMPDFIRCHDWGYENLFEWDKTSNHNLLVFAHLLADWYVHYGKWTTERKRRGWAYQKLVTFSKRYDEFFSRSLQMGLRDDGDPLDSIRGFSHTMVEYSIDAYLSYKGAFDPYFAQVKDLLGNLAIKSGTGSVDWVKETIQRDNIHSNSPDLLVDLKSFQSRVAQSEKPIDIVHYAGMNKFGLRSCEESKEFFAQFIEDGLSEIPADEFETIINETAEFIKNWVLKIHPDQLTYSL